MRSTPLAVWPLPRTPLIIASALCLIVALSAAPGRAQPARAGESLDSTEVSAANLEELLLQVTLNGVSQGDEPRFILRDSMGRWWVSEQDLQGWRIRLPEGAAHTLDGVDYVLLDDISGATATFESATLRIALTVPGEAFEAATFAADAARSAEANRPGWGTFLDYDLLGQRGGAVTLAEGSFDAGLYSPWGIGNTQFLSRSDGNERTSIRLDTAWTFDLPEKLSTLRFGDSISRSASGWGRSVRFAGFQYGTNFATQPGLVLLPQQSVAGTAVVPSTVDVFVNNSLINHQEVPAGPFTINNVPIMSGVGTMQVVVRDAMGREQLIERSFVGSAFLLRQGLNDYSFEAGKLRNNFALVSDDYRDRFGAGTWRRGFSEWFTGEVHAETIETGERATGLGGAFLLGKLGAINLTAASSTSAQGRGSLVGVAFQHQGRTSGVALRAEQSSRNFWQVGRDSSVPAPRLLADAMVGFSLARLGSLNFSYVYQEYREPELQNVRLGSFGWSFLLPRSIYAGFTFARAFSDEADTTAGLFINIPLGRLTNASTYTQRTKTALGTRQSSVAEVTRSLPIGRGAGYRLRGEDNGNALAGASYQSNYGSFAADYTKLNDETYGRVQLQGSILTLGRYAFASRRSTDSFALVQVPGFDNVRVYNGNQLVGRTNRNGNAIVPRLLAYQQNRLSIEEQDLPLDARVTDLSRTAIPWYRSGMKVQFPVTRSRSAEMHLVDESGAPLPEGVYATVEGGSERFIVAQDGRLFLTGLADKTRIHVELGNDRCEVDVELGQGSDPLPDLGTLTCQGTLP